MNTAIKRLSHLGIDLAAEPRQTAKGRLNVTAGAAKTIVKVEMPQSGVDIIQPHQARHTAAKPDAFRVSGRAIDRLRRFGELVGPALIVLGPVRRLSISACWFARLVLGTAVATLGERASEADPQSKAQDDKMPKNQFLDLKQPTHNFPD